MILNNENIADVTCKNDRKLEGNPVKPTTSKQSLHSNPEIRIEYQDGELAILSESLPIFTHSFYYAPIGGALSDDAV